MKLMRVFACALLSLAPLAAGAETMCGKLEGTWVETRPVQGSARTTLHFEGDTVRIGNVYKTPVTVRYSTTQKHNGCEVTAQYRHKVTRGNGCVVDRTDIFEFLLHEEDGVAILSETVFEYDGRGLLIFREFLREDRFTDGFESRLSKKLRNTVPAKTVME